MSEPGNPRPALIIPPQLHVYTHCQSPFSKKQPLGLRDSLKPTLPGFGLCVSSAELCRERGSLLLELSTPFAQLRELLFHLGLFGNHLPSQLRLLLLQSTPRRGQGVANVSARLGFRVTLSGKKQHVKEHILGC